MKLNRLLLLATTLLTLFAVNASQVAAQYTTPTSPSKSLQLIKRVQDPRDSQFTKDLKGYAFSQNQDITFQLEVKNNGQTELNNLQVKDKLPSVLDFVSGPGSYDTANSTLNIQIDKITAGNSKTVEFKAHIKADAGAACYTNFAEVRVEDLYSSDTQMFCVNVAKALPQSGPEDNFLFLGLSIFALSGGFYLKRFARNLI